MNASTPTLPAPVASLRINWAARWVVSLAVSSAVSLAALSLAGCNNPDDPADHPADDPAVSETPATSPPADATGDARAAATGATPAKDRESVTPPGSATVGPPAGPPAGPTADPTKTDIELTKLVDAVAEDPENAEAHQALARAHARRRQWPEAKAALESALELNAEFHVARADLGEVLIQMAQCDEGLALLQQATPAQPDDAELQFRLAIGLRSCERLDEADVLLTLTLNRKTDYSRARFERGILRASRGRLADAAIDFEQVTKERPTMLAAHINLGRALESDLRPKEAAAAYRAALEQLPEHPELLAALAWLLATHADPEARDSTEAVRLGQRLCHRDKYKNPLFLDVLAAACAESGLFIPAIRYATDALDVYMDPAGPGTRGQYAHHIEALQLRLALYQQDKPYHAPPVEREAGSGG